jgi:hypothetical protein
MSLARVVSFEGVSSERIAEMKSEIESGERPEGLDVTEMLVLHNSDEERSLAILFFDSDEAYRRGDEILNAMPGPDTPGRRTSVSRYDVAIRATS